MKKAVLSLSGGMDSTCLLIHLLSKGFEVKAYSFDYGQRHRIEIECVKRNIEYLQSKKLPVSWAVIDLKSVFSESTSALLPQSGVMVPEGHYTDENMKKTVVENRNGIFASCLYGKALAWANQTKEDIKICMGIHSGDHQIYPDCREESRNAFAFAFKISNWDSERVDYYTPYLSLDKFGILVDTRHNCDSLSLSFTTVLKNTNTCYNPNSKGEACGKCGSCVERLEAFEKLKSTDPIVYLK